MTKLIGIQVLYYPPKGETKHYTTYTELQSMYYDPILIGVIFEEHPNQQTLRKIGWLSELQENSSIIHVDYDLPNLQQGAMFLIPSGLDDGKGRLFRVVRLSNELVYPASVTCELVPEYIDNFTPETNYDYERTSFNLLNRDGEPEVTMSILQDDED